MKKMMQKLEEENREEEYQGRGRKGNFFLLFEIMSCKTDWSSASSTAGICNGKPKVNIMPESFSQQKGHGMKYWSKTHRLITLTALLHLHSSILELSPMCWLVFELEL